MRVSQYLSVHLSKSHVVHLISGFRGLVYMRFGTDALGIDELGTDGLVDVRLGKPSCAS